MKINVDINIVASTKNGGKYNERGVQRIIPNHALANVRNQACNLLASL
jgi:hypothetical protein